MLTANAKDKKVFTEAMGAAFTCVKCERVYKHSSSLSRHKKTCTGEKKVEKSAPKNQLCWKKGKQNISGSI